MDKGEGKDRSKGVRVWADGCFDLFHYGHANSLRQARSLGDYLVVGVHSDAAILKHKGPMIMNEKERYAAVRACKWVDEVVEDAPYVTELSVLDEHNIDFCVHGEDITTTEEGLDCYGAVKAAGRYQTIKRTKGVSTTDIVGRIVLHSKKHMILQGKDQSALEGLDKDVLRRMSVGNQEEDTSSPYTTGMSHFVPSTRQIAQFSEGSRQPKPSDTVVYIDGAFDLFHAGHVDAIRRAKQLGSYIIVGLHDDQTVNRVKGGNLPILNLHERVLSVLSCRYVDEVLIGAPWIITQELIEHMQIDLVAHGSAPVEFSAKAPDPYQIPRQLGVLKQFESPRADISTDSILNRVFNSIQVYERRNRKKQQSELEYMKAH